jgi:hypothetical protein
MKNKFSLNKIKKVGEKVTSSYCGGYTCLFMEWIINEEHKVIYSNLFDFKGMDSLEHVLTHIYKEVHSEKDCIDLRLMLVAMFYEIARRENGGENILPES